MPSNTEMAPQASTAQANAVDAVIDRSWSWCALSAVAATAAALVRAPVPVAYGYAVIGALVLAALVLASLRHYHFWLSWTVWLLPVQPIAIVAEPLRSGAVAIRPVLFVYALAFALMFGAFFMARKRVRIWVMNSAF